LQAGGREIALDQIRGREAGVLEIAAHIGEPAGFLELALLDVIAD